MSSSDVVNVTDGLRFNGKNVARLLRDELVASSGESSPGEGRAISGLRYQDTQALKT